MPLVLRKATRHLQVAPAGISLTPNALTKGAPVKL